MRLIPIVLSLTALVFASGAIAQSPSNNKIARQQQSGAGEYAEKAPYRPCPRSMAATYAWAAPDGVRGLRRLRNSSADLRSGETVIIAHACTAPAIYQKNRYNHRIWSGRCWNCVSDHHLY
jgi:hypothetical protein